jgi:hypothetical protein
MPGKSAGTAQVFRNTGRQLFTAEPPKNGHRSVVTDKAAAGEERSEQGDGAIRERVAMEIVDHDPVPGDPGEILEQCPRFVVGAVMEEK